MATFKNTAETGQWLLLPAAVAVLLNLNVQVSLASTGADLSFCSLQPYTHICYTVFPAL